MSVLPFPWTAYVHTWSAGVQDDYGEYADTYTPAKTAAGTAVKAFWATPRSTEPPLAGHDRVTVDVELFVPHDTAISAHDLVDLGSPPSTSNQYEVIGEPGNWNCGPFGPHDWPLRVALRKVSG